MKGIVLWVVVTGVAVADGKEIEGEVWYDADGEVAFVEGPAAADAEERFVPTWEMRERERAASREQQRFHRGGHRSWYGHRGWSVWRSGVPRPWPVCPMPRRGGVLIILR